MGVQVLAPGVPPEREGVQAAQQAGFFRIKKALDRKEPDEGAAIRPNDDKESITWETDICKR